MANEVDPEEMGIVQFDREEDGSITATDTKTGLARGGRTRLEALADLAEVLTLEEGEGEPIDDRGEFLRDLGIDPDTDGKSSIHPQYVPDAKMRYLLRIRELTESYSRKELRKEVAEIQDEIDAWKDRFDVANYEELEATLTSGNLTGDEIRQRNRILCQWDRNEEAETLLQHALGLYDTLADLEGEPSSASLT